MVFVQLCTPFVKLGDYFPFVQSRRVLAKQNEELHQENDVLRQEVRALSETGRENIRLRELLNLKEHAAFTPSPRASSAATRPTGGRASRSTAGATMAFSKTWPSS